MKSVVEVFCLPFPSAILPKWHASMDMPHSQAFFEDDIINIFKGSIVTYNPLKYLNRSDWLLKVTWLVLTNHTALFQHTKAYVIPNFVTGTNIPQRCVWRKSIWEGSNFFIPVRYYFWPTDVQSVRRSLLCLIFNFQFWCFSKKTFYF